MGTRRRVDGQLAVLDLEPDAGQRRPHRAGPCAALAGRPGELAGLGLAVAVADLEPRRLLPRAEHLGVQRLAGRHQPAQRGQGAQARALGDHPVLGRRHAEDRHPLALEQLEALVRVEARVVEQRGGAHQPRRDEHVAR